MVESEKDCQDVLQQLRAVEAALRAAGFELVNCEIKETTAAIRNNCSVERWNEELSRLCPLYAALNRRSWKSR